MELRIGINNCRKQLAGIGRDHLCDFQNGVQYQFLVGASSQDIKATLTANAKSQTTKANDVMKPQAPINLLKR